MNLLRGTISTFLRHLRCIEKSSKFSPSFGVSCRHVTGSTAADHSLKIKPFSEIPGPTGIYSLPYIGTALSFEPFTKHTPQKIHLVFKEFNQKYGDLVKFRAGKIWNVLLFNPDDAQKVVTVPQEHPYRAPVDIIQAYCKRNNLPEGLPTLQGADWQALRKPAQEQMLKPKTVQNYIPLINSVAEDFVEKLRKQGNIDDCLKELFAYTTESIGLLCYNIRLGYFTDEKPKFDMMPPLLEIFDILQRSFYSINHSYKYFRSPLYKRYENASKALTKVSKELFEESKKQLEKRKQEGVFQDDDEPNLLYSLMSDPRLTIVQVHSLIESLFGGGIDSTSNSMTFLLHKLASNIDKQEILRMEVLSKWPVGKPLEKDTFSNMPYLKACLKESFRMVPPGIISASRKFPHDITVGGYQIPKNTDIMVITNAMSENENLFPQADKFIPERWLRSSDLDSSQSRNIYPFTSIPFGFGPRSCIGQRFAEYEIYVGVAKIIQNFRLRLPDDAKEMDFIYKTFATPNQTVKLILEEL